jgi:hypothetical protein
MGLIQLLFACHIENWKHACKPIEQIHNFAFALLSKHVVTIFKFKFKSFIVVQIHIVLTKKYKNYKTQIS